MKHCTKPVIARAAVSLCMGVADAKPHKYKDRGMTKSPIVEAADRTIATCLITRELKED
jgi:hypothetical protein